MNNKIISPFQFEKNLVNEFELKYDDDAICEESIAVELEVAILRVSYTKEELSYNGCVELLIKIDGTCKENSVMNISLKTTGYFNGDINELNEERFAQLLKINGTATLMQLSRAYITSITALSGFRTPFQFPMINVIELVECYDQDKQSE